MLQKAENRCAEGASLGTLLASRWPKWKSRLESVDVKPPVFVLQEGFLAVVAPLGDVVRNTLRNHTRLTSAYHGCHRSFVTDLSTNQRTQIMVVNRREVLKVTALAGLASPTVVRAQNPQSTDGAGTKYAFSKDGTRIAYQVIGAGPTLVMQHGFGQDRNTWLVNRYAEALTERFRLLLIDAKGHGESGGPASQDAYSHARCAQDVAAVVEAECDEPPTFWGYSMGGRIGFSCMAYTPDLYRSFVIGAHYSSLFEISEAATKSRIARAKKFEKGLEALGAEEQERFMNANLPAFAAYSRSVAVFDPTLRDMLSTFSGPTLFYVGGEDAERLRNLEARHGRRLIEYLTNPTFVEIPGGLGHGETHRRSDLVLPHVLRFLAQA